MGFRVAGDTGGAPSGGSDAPTAERIIAWLTAAGADRQGHAEGRSLLDHLVGTYEIARRWSQPEPIQHAALLHSVYGTEAYPRPLVPTARRAEVRALAGDEAERLAHLFGVTPRRLLFAGTYRWLRGLPGTDAGEAPSRAELDAVLLLHLANLAEQARAPDGSPGAWLVRLHELAELLAEGDAVTPPPFAAALGALTEEDERRARHAYAAGGAAEDSGERTTQLALAAAICPVVPEPCLWLACVARVRGDAVAAAEWAAHGLRRLLDLGTSWDKRLTFEEWLRLAHWLHEPGAVAADAHHPRDLLAALEGGDRSPDTAGGARLGDARLLRYLDTLAEADPAAGRGVYPDLPSRPWFDAADFPLARYLETHFEEIRAEIGALDATSFHSESEPIRRSGEWEVAFLYERGRRRDEVCEACPVTTRGIERHGALRTPAGLAYVSRMRPGTHIAAHRGPTNLRVRCHLGIEVPDGDCAIRVGEETRRWTAGRCLVFDDHFEHEAWNHTAEDRIVLIVDLWHPGLSATEIRRLSGLQRYVYGSARRLTGYWAANQAAAQNSPSPPPPKSPPKSPPSPPKSPPSPP